MAGANSLSPRLVNSSSRGDFHARRPWDDLKFRVRDWPKSLQQRQILLTDRSTVVVMCHRKTPSSRSGRRCFAMAQNHSQTSPLEDWIGLRLYKHHWDSSISSMVFFLNCIYNASQPPTLEVTRPLSKPPNPRTVIKPGRLVRSSISATKLDLDYQTILSTPFL